MGKKKKDLSDKEIEAAFIANGGIPKPKKEIKKSIGRPSHYDKISLDDVRKWASIGLSNEQISQLLNIDQSNFYIWQRDKQEFREALKGGKELPDDKIERSLFERASGYYHPEEKLFYDSNTGQVVSQIVLKHYPPDPTSMIFWLKNRRREQWRDQPKDESQQPQNVTQLLQDIAKALTVRDG